MQTLRQHKSLFAVAALVLVFAGCKGESPTAPSTTTTPTTTSGGTTPPPTTVNINLAVSNATPQVNSTSVITATVTDSTGQPEPNGTAVEFTTNLGTFAEGNAQTVIRTTTSGVATVTLTSAVVGPATISAIVANVKKTATVTFSAVPVTPQPPDTSPSITGITPNFGRPQGGEVVTITGKNFRTPLRVFFDFGAGTTPKDATIISSTGTTIQVLTPSVDLGTGQQLTATVKVINEAGSANEVTVTGPTFTYQAAVLTPKITTVSPASGPIDGGTRVTVYGEGFQSPIQVFFGAAEAQVIGPVLFNQFTLATPSARDATPDASGSGAGTSVSIRVININSATSVTLANAFRYVPKMAITTAGPTEGPFTGGTHVTINGTGFNDPVAVVIGGIAAQPISVSGSQIVAVTSPTLVTGCADVVGAITVTNVDNGDSANGPNFTYRVTKPIIISVTPGTVGGQITVVISGAASGVPRLTIGDQPLAITGSSTDASTGLTTFTATIPLTLAASLHTQACSAGGTVPIPTALSLNYTNASTGCSTTLTNGIIVSPAAIAAVTLNPAAFGPFTSTPKVWPPIVTGGPSAPQTLNIVNNSPFAIKATNVTKSGCGNFAVGGSPIPTTLNSCDVFQVTGQYTFFASPMTDTCTVSIDFVDAATSTPLFTKTLVLNGTAQ
jgi:hypothetical protein